MFPSCYPISQIPGPIYSPPSMKNTITFCSIGLFFREKWVWGQRLGSQNQSYHRFFKWLALRANRCWNNFGRSSIQIPVIPVLFCFFLFLSPFFNFGPVFRDHIQKRRKKKKVSRCRNSFKKMKSQGARHTSNVGVAIRSHFLFGFCRFPDTSGTL